MPDSARQKNDGVLFIAQGGTWEHPLLPLRLPALFLLQRYNFAGGYDPLCKSLPANMSLICPVEVSVQLLG